MSRTPLLVAAPPRPRPHPSTPGLWVASLLTLTLACTKPDTTEDSVEEREDSSTTEDSSTEEDTAPVGEGRVSLSFFTAIELGGYGFGSEEGDGYGLLKWIQGNAVIGQYGEPGHWSSFVISPDLTACDVGETVFVGDGESYEWTYITEPLPGEFFLDTFSCVMP
ncbi:MAG: hypothetical protein RIT28_4804 [Pseudomonadota bacterium]